MRFEDWGKLHNEDLHIRVVMMIIKYKIIFNFKIYFYLIIISEREDISLMVFVKILK